MSKGNKKEKISSKGLILRFILLFAYLLFLLYLYSILLEFGSHPLIAFFLLLFVFLIVIGPFFKNKRGSLYSRMFPDKKKRLENERERRKRTPIMKKEPKQIQSKIFQAVDLEYEYRKPLISNCENCGNILPNFIKNKCPFCGVQI
jgi:hypothetical protein